MTLYRGEPAVIFSKEEVSVMAAPFKLSLIGKFSFGRPSMELIRKFFVSLGLKGSFQISLLDQRHVLIKLSLEEDYTRVWLRQSWFISGRSMRILKWSTNFRCSEELPIVPVWISFPYLPIHFVNCKQAIYSIAAAVGKPLRVDHATASGTRPSVARVLIEFDVCQPLIHRIWIGEGEQEFWQDIIFEKVPLYCVVCKHLGHDQKTCYIPNSDLRILRKNNDRVQGSGKPNSGKATVEPARPSNIDVAQPLQPLNNFHRNHAQSDTDSREEPAEGLQELQKNYKIMETDAPNPGTAHTDNRSRDATAEGLLESQKNSGLDGMEGHAALVTSHGDKENSMEAGEDGTDKGKFVAAGTCTLANALHENNGHVAAVHGGPASGDVQLSCPPLLPGQREGIQAALGEELVSITVSPPPLTMPDVGQLAPEIGPQEEVNQPIEEGKAQLHFQPKTRTNLAQQNKAHVEAAHGFDSILGHQPTQEGNPQPHFQPTTQPNLNQQSTAQEDAVRGLEPILGNLPKSQAQPTILQPTTKATRDANDGNMDPIMSTDSLSPIPMQDHVAPQPITDNGPIQPTELLSPASHGSDDPQTICSSLQAGNRTRVASSGQGTKSFSFQAGQRIEFNPNPTVVVVDSLPMPKPIYISEDYITDGTVDEADSFYMPDYSHVSFNTHSSTIPDDTYYGPISRSHSLDDREFCDEEIGIDARCGISDSAIDKRINTDSDGFTKVTPRKSRQYHLRPRNRRR